MSVQLCGRLAVQLAGAHVESRLRGRQGRLLFAHLVVNRNRTLTREELVDAVWPYEPPARPGPTLSTLLSQLRAALGPDLVQGRSEVQLVLPNGTWVDLEAAAEAVGRAEAALARGDWRGAWSPAHVARTIAERGFMPGYDAPWIDLRRRAVEDLLIEALECLATVGVRLGGSELAAAERAARRLVELAPLRESGHVTLMEIHAARGNAAEALRVYDQLRRLLRDELGTAPGAAAQAVHLRLLDAGVDAGPARVPAAAVKPALALPPLLEADPSVGFVGRERELERLQLALERSRDMRRQLVLVAGEPGIGKTRIVTELGRRAFAWGATVLYGRTDEAGLVPYGPLLEAVRQHALQAPPALLRRGYELGGDLLRGVMPALRAPAVPAQAGETEPAIARYRLFDAFAALFADAARDAPVVLILDDLHWADEPTLLLLRHVLRAPDQQHLLVIATYRDTEVHRATLLLDALADLQRDVPVDRVHLRGLARADLAELARETGPGEAPEALVAVIHDETDGNPFLALELLRHVASGGGIGDELPEGVRDVIARRLARLSEPAQRALRTAAALGREFDLDTLELAGDVHGETLLEAMEEAVAARVVDEDPERADRYGFTHALTRKAVYGALTGPRRLRIHGRIADALAQLAAAGRPVAVAEIAAHALSALPRGGAERAIDLSAGAAAQATQLLAYEDATAHLERALDALERHRPEDVARRAALLSELGHSHRRSGRMPEARNTFLRAIEEARRLGDSELLARCVLGYGGRGFESAFLDETMIALLEEALGRIEDRDGLLRLELLARLAKALYYSEREGDEARRADVAEQVIAMAERLGGPQPLLVALEGRHFALARPDNLAERLAIAERIVALAREVGDRERELVGRSFLIADLVEADRMDDADGEIKAYGELADVSRTPVHRWYHARMRAMRALLEGRAEAEALVHEAFELGRPVEPRTASMHFGVQSWFLGHLQGRLSSLEESVRGFAPEYPRAVGWRLGVAYVLLDQGHRDEAADVFRPFSESGFRNIPEDANWGAGVALAAGLVAVGIGDARDAAALFELVAPHAGRNAVTAEMIVCLGPLSLYAGLMALVAGRIGDAVDHLEDALARCDRMRSRPFAHTAIMALAGALAARGGPGDSERGQALADRAEAMARDMAGAIESARRLGLGVL